jgi:hypothetical protein
VLDVDRSGTLLSSGSQRSIAPERGDEASLDVAGLWQTERDDLWATALLGR